MAIFDYIDGRDFDKPELWEGIEIEIVIQAVFVLRKQMVPTDSQQIEADRRHISVKRDIGGRKKRIVPIGAI